MDFARSTIYDVDIDSARTKLALSNSQQDTFDHFIVISVSKYIEFFLYFILLA